MIRQLQHQLQELHNTKQNQRQDDQQGHRPDLQQYHRTPQTTMMVKPPICCNSTVQPL